MVRVQMPNGLYHFGVYVSDKEIIQFGFNPTARAGVRSCDVEVCVSDTNDFLNGGVLEVGETETQDENKRKSPEDTVFSARQRLGEKGYHILYNNCEHFAYECVLGENYCSQTETLRFFFQNIPIVEVYVAAIPQDTTISCVYPPERQEEIDECTNEKVKREKYYVWKLLEYALSRSFGYKLQNQTFRKNERGKWECGNCFFSLSHSKNAVAVALSRKNVGVDIELYEPERFLPLANKLLNENERLAYETTPNEQKSEFLIGKWTEKESIFKTLDIVGCKISSVDTLSAKTKTKMIDIQGEKYCLSVASENAEKTRFFENIDLTNV